MHMTQRNHWDKIFGEKIDQQKSWFQSYPAKFIEELNLAKDAPIFDVGDGDSLLVDALIEKEYTDITVLDISAVAIANAQRRLGNKADLVTWVISDILDFQPVRNLACWHDRAVFHFVTDHQNIGRYTTLMARTLKEGGALVIGTFAEDGPEKCSNLPVQRYSQKALTDLLKPSFTKIRCVNQVHQTPINTL
jgi:SAM-dependent methyltransferase